MIHKITFVRKIINIISGCLFAWLFTAFVSIVFFREEVYAFFVPCIIWIYIVAYLVREFAPNWLVILLAQAAALIPLYFVGTDMRFIIVFGLIGLKLSVDGYRYIKNGRILQYAESVPGHIFLFCFVFFLYGYYVKSEELKSASYYILAALILLYLVNLYISGLEKYLNSAKGVSGIPLKNIIKTNSVMVVSIILVLVIAILLCNMYNWQHAADAVIRGALAVIKLIGAGILFVFNLLKLLFMRGGISQNPIAEQLPEIDYADSGYDAFRFLRIIFVVILAGLAIRQIIKFLRKLLIRHNKLSDMVEDVNIKELSDVRKQKTKRLFGGLFSPQERARRMYKGYILGYRYDICLNSTKTCQDIKTEISDETGDDVSKLTSLYSDIRYGPENADKNIVRAMYELTRKS